MCLASHRFRRPMVLNSGGPLAALLPPPTPAGAVCACGRAGGGGGALPILAGGTGFYYRALTRGLFPGPGRDAALRRRLESIAERRGVPFLHRLLKRVDPGSAQRIQ